MQDAVADLMHLVQGAHDTLASIEASHPGRDATPEQQAAFLTALRPVIAEAQLSVAQASGSLAYHLRRTRRSSLN